jgi:uncharacterized protein with HEPN domain
VSRGDSDRIADILRAIDRCERFSGSLNSENPDLSDMAMDAVERNLQVVGEAANHLSAVVTGAHTEIPWPEIRGFRNILVHQYFSIDPSILLEVIEQHLPPLRDALIRSQDRHA